MSAGGGAKKMARTCTPLNYWLPIHFEALYNFLTVLGIQGIGGIYLVHDEFWTRREGGRGVHGVRALAAALWLWRCGARMSWLASPSPHWSRLEPQTMGAAAREMRRGDGGAEEA